MQTHSLRNRYLFGFFALIACASLGTTFYLTYTGERMAQQHSPLVDAAMEIKLNATLGHLWFEEIASGDRNENISSVWAYLQKADWYAKAMLRGDQNTEGNFQALTDPQMRQRIEDVRVALSEFRKIAEYRFDNLSNSLPGSDIDQEFDSVFSHFMLKADEVETMLQENIKNDLHAFKTTSRLLIASSMAFFLVIGIALFRLEQQRRSQLQALQQAHSELNYLAHFDNLTALPNRTLFVDRLEQAVARADRRSAHVVLLFIDLDNFKSVNDRLGHAAGDEVLHNTALRLRKTLRESDSVARLAGDEFTVLLSDFNSQEKANAAAQSVARSILHELSQPYGIQHQTAYVSASIGVAIYPQDAGTADELLVNADHAMYAAKQEPDHLHFFSEQLNAKVAHFLRVESDLREAVAQNQLTVFYQPQWNVQDNSLVGFEALVRWQHPTQGLLAPNDFTPIAESVGLIEKIDTWVLEKACQQCADWRAQGLKPGKLSVNISANLFSRPDMIRIVSATAAQFCLPSGELELELTESTLLENTQNTRTLLAQLESQGINLAIDDFGTGYASLVYLQDFPAKTLKLDKSFIERINQDPATNAIVRSVIDLANKLDMTVIAEGVENVIQHQFVAEAGCTIVQGFLFGKPLPADETENLLIGLKEDNISQFPLQGD